jgi:hypothetical protein
VWKGIRPLKSAMAKVKPVQTDFFDWAELEHALETTSAVDNAA